RRRGARGRRPRRRRGRPRRGDGGARVPRGRSARDAPRRRLRAVAQGGQAPAAHRLRDVRPRVRDGHDRAARGNTAPRCARSGGGRRPRHGGHGRRGRRARRARGRRRRRDGLPPGARRTGWSGAARGPRGDHARPRRVVGLPLRSSRLVVGTVSAVVGLRKEARMSENTRTSRAPEKSGQQPSSGSSGSGGRGVRSRLVRFGARPNAGSPALEPVLQAVRTNHPRTDLSVIERAYETAERAHRGQLRKSGDPYITHPVAVATILAELGFDGSTLAAALLHDTVEDTEYSLSQLTEEYGEEIAMLVDGVTKLDKVTYGDAAQAETVRKMVVAMARDIRVLVIKLADRL